MAVVPNPTTLKVWELDFACIQCQSDILGSSQLGRYLKVVIDFLYMKETIDLRTG